MEDFDTTLYFLEDREVEYLRKEAEREYGQDLRRNVLAMLFDLLELQTYGTVRAELIGIVENFIPYLLGAADFRSVSYILRETRVVLERARELIPEQRAILVGLPGRLSQGRSPVAAAAVAGRGDGASDRGRADRHVQRDAAGSAGDPDGMDPEAHQRAGARSGQWIGLAPGAGARRRSAQGAGGDDPGAQLEMVRLAGRLSCPARWRRWVRCSRTATVR